jgi:Phospholipase_D-nuclease N-terminal
MMLGAYTFWDAIWTMIVFFAWIMFITWVILLMIDNFRRSDHSGWAKAGWALFIIFLPIIGAVTYTIARPASASDYGYEGSYGYGSARSAPTSTAEELARLNELRTEGAISDAEFADLKARTIAAS